MNKLIRILGGGLRCFNRWMAIIAALLIVIATVALVYEVITRYYVEIANDWMIEFCVYLLIAATFLAAAYTQAERGHVGIEVLDEVMSPKWNRVRLMIGDALSAIVVFVVAHNAWHYSWDAYQQGWTTSSTWAPPLWIPYFLMAFGLSTTGLQMIVQILETLAVRGAHEKPQNLTGA
ncbi:MAG TPA: TRAP transporter small permease [Oxalicibacterium sp.]